jgi:DNA repair protein RecN (Recombination protein N)
MLRELHISNLAVIEDIAMTFEPALNCFTGQTGAGKSLVIGAFEILLGLRSAGDMLRQGTEEGRVSGVFELTDTALVEQINTVCDAQLDPPAAKTPAQLLITRKLFASGRTSVSINGQPATLGMLQTVGELLVDVHGQHDHQYLLKPANQLLMLDRFGECEQLAQRFAAAHDQLRQLTERQAQLSASRTLRQQQLELYEFQAEEIDQVEPTDGEFEELSARYRLLSNIERIARDGGAAYAALYETDGAICERLAATVGLLRQLAELDEPLQEVAEELRGAAAQVQDASFTLSRYLNRLELDPGELEEVEQRLNVLNRLISKYGDGPAAGQLSQVIAYRQQIAEQIERLRGESEDLDAIAREIDPLREKLNQIGQALTDARRKAADRLTPLVEEQLAALGMADAKLQVQFDTDATRSSPAGFDQIELLVRTNPGQPVRPLRKVASGGELSRLMLALKSILAQSDRISVLVFDEVDANIGGRMGSIIGQKLRQLASHHQVLCITHLPQIAAFAEHHLKIAKQVDNGQTRTIVEPLDADRRIDELAEMLTGKHATRTTRKQARELLNLADELATAG